MPLTLRRLPRRFDEIVESSLRRSSAALARRNLAVTHQIATDVPEYSLDEELMGEAVDVLIGESIRNAEPASRLRVTVKASPQAMMLAVKSSGPGVSDVQREMLFTGEARPGTLARAMAIVAAHGGTAWANGRRGKGLTYYITLPVRRSA